MAPSSSSSPRKIAPATGKLGVLTVGLGAVSSTLIAGVELAKRGIQEWLSFYCKSPQVAEGLYPEHDLFIQLTKLKNTLRWMRGEEQITHLGREYYDEV